MTEAPFIDFYELLEASPKASAEAIESLFRVMAKRYHPEFGTSKDVDKYKQLTQAYQVLRDPALRAAYDASYRQRVQENKELHQGAEATADDYALRNRMLTLFYAQRRRDMKQPGVGIARLEEVLGIPTEIIEFHLWYFREKGWVQREVSGPLSITVAGVDEIESREKRNATQAIPIVVHTGEIANLPLGIL
jgi:curved DNA-binding protein CbpA